MVLTTLLQRKARFLIPVLSISFGALALVGWVLDIDFLREGGGTGVSMNPVTAIGFVLLGLEALRLYVRNTDLLTSKAGLIAIWIVIIVATLKLSDAYMGTLFAIDQYLFASRLNTDFAHPSRVAPATAICFFALGWAMQFMRSNSSAVIRVAQTISLITLLIAFLAILGYAYGVENLIAVGAFNSMSINTALGFLFLSVAALFVHYDDGFMFALTTEGPARKIAIILFPATLTIPFLLNFGILKMQQAGFYTSTFNNIISVVLDVFVFLVLIFISLRALFFSDLQRQKILDELRENEQRFRGLVEQSIAGICIIQDEKFTYANPRLAGIMGLDSAKELIGSDPLSWIVETDRAEVARNIRRLLKGEVQNLALEFGVLHRDGMNIRVGTNAARATQRGKVAIVGVAQDISEKKRAEEKILDYIEQLKTTLKGTIEVVEIISEMRDPYTAGHERRVAQIAVDLAVALGLDAHRQEGLRVASNLHDVGKLMIPAEILSKPSKLSLAEYALVQGHVQAGYEILKNVKFPWPVAEVVLQHHERMDGSGYPQGLKGDDILFEARIMTVADVVEAMGSHRPYRPGLNIEVALEEIERNRGVKYDAKVVDACLKLFRNQGYALAI